MIAFVVVMGSENVFSCKNFRDLSRKAIVSESRVAKVLVRLPVQVLPPRPRYLYLVLHCFNLGYARTDEGVIGFAFTPILFKHN